MMHDMEFLMATNELLTPEESAVYLKMHVDSVRRLLRSGKVPGVKIGGAWRVRKIVLDALLAVGLNAPTAREEMIARLREFVSKEACVPLRDGDTKVKVISVLPPPPVTHSPDWFSFFQASTLTVSLSDGGRVIVNGVERLEFDVRGSDVFSLAGAPCSPNHVGSRYASLAASD
jgi:excisionase family DNA binding protein